MRIEILNNEQEALQRIQQLRDEGIRENQLSVIHDAYKDVDVVEDQTDVDTIEVREDRRDESIFDRFVNWVSGRDTLDHLFERFDVVESDQSRYYDAVQNGKVLLAVEEDADIADTHFRSAHVNDSPGGGPFVGTTEPIDPFIGGTHHPDGTTGTVAGDPYPGESVPEFDNERVAGEHDARLQKEDEELSRDMDRSEGGLFGDKRQDPEEYQNYRPRMDHDRGLRDQDEHIYSKDERDAYVTRGEGDDNLRIDEPNYVTDDDLKDSDVRPRDSQQPGLDRIHEDSLNDYSEPRFDTGEVNQRDELADRERRRTESDPLWEGNENLRIREENYVTDEDARREPGYQEQPPRDDFEMSEEERVREQARREELNDDERRRYNDGEIPEGDLQKPGEPIFGDGPKPEEVDDDQGRDDRIFNSDEERLRRRDEGLINPDEDRVRNDDPARDSMLETEEERLIREEAERRGGYSSGKDERI